MGNPRDTFKYQFKVGNKIVHGGITTELERREQEHQQTWPKGHIKQVGRRTTDEAAREWEKSKGYTKSGHRPGSFDDSERRPWRCPPHEY